MQSKSKAVRGLRWWIAVMLFASTVINFIDRQSFSALAPILKSDYHWTNRDFALVLISFRIAYTIMQAVGGRILDFLGTKKGLSLAVAFYSTISALTSIAGGLASFSIFRFLLGMGEAPNWPGATKAVGEWFPARERAWAVALFDSGSSIGGLLAPLIVLWVYRVFHSWHPVFLMTGCLGFLWLIAWRRLYDSPTRHAKISPQELAHISQDAAVPSNQEGPLNWGGLLRYRQTWGIILGRFLLDPYWYLMTEWFAIFLVSKGFKIEQSIIGFWLPFVGADIGNLFGGWLSSWWISRGWPVDRARRTVVLVFGPTMLVLLATAFASQYVLLVGIFGYASFAYSACSTMFLSLPADIFKARAVASVSGLSGTGAGLGTLISTYFIGRISDRFSFQPILIAAAIIPCLATGIIVSLVRAPKEISSTTTALAL